jgi:hypothetical protein
MTPRGHVAQGLLDEAGEVEDGGDRQGTLAASGPMEVPAITRVKGEIATSRMMKGKSAPR